MVAICTESYCNLRMILAWPSHNNKSVISFGTRLSHDNNFYIFWGTGLSHENKSVILGRPPRWSDKYIIFWGKTVDGNAIILHNFSKKNRETKTRISHGTNNNKVNIDQFFKMQPDLTTLRKSTQRSGREDLRNIPDTQHAPGHTVGASYQVVLCLSDIWVIRTKFVFVDVKGTLVVLLHLVAYTVTTTMIGTQAEHGPWTWGHSLSKFGQICKQIQVSSLFSHRGTIVKSR